MADDDDDRKLFEEALGNISERDLFRGKFGDPAQAKPSDTADKPVDEEAVAELERLRDLRAMEYAFEGIERMDQDKVHRPKPPPPVETPGAERAKPPPPEPQVEEPVVARAPGEVPVSQLVDEPQMLNLRGAKPGKAIVRLALAVDLASKDGVPVFHTIAGREPSLRSAVLEWFAGPGAVYVRRKEIVDPEGDTQVFVALRSGKQ